MLEQLLEEIRQITKILITGSSGYLGRCLWQVLDENKDYKLWGVDQKPSASLPRRIQRDLSDRELVQRLLQEVRPDVIIHAAAFKYVDSAEVEVERVIESNLMATQHLVTESLAQGVSQFVYIGTDKAVIPMGIMGISKRIAEDYVLSKAISSSMNAQVLRVGNIVASDGSIIPRMKAWINRDEPLQITDFNASRYYVDVNAVIDGIEELLKIRDSGKWLLKMKPPKSLREVVNTFLSQHRLSVDYPVELIGMQPGEKISEVLLEASEWIEHANLYGSIELIQGYHLPHAAKFEQIFERLNNDLALPNEQLKHLLQEVYLQLYRDQFSKEADVDIS